MSYQPYTGITSIVNTIPSSVLVGASIIGVTPVSGTVFVAGSIATVGSVTALQGTNPWIVNSTGSVAVAINSTNTSIFTVRTGTQITSVMNTLPSSLMVGASVFGTVPVTQTTSPWVVNVPTPSYIMYQAAGSILAVSATVNTGNSSVQLVNSNAVVGSVAAFQGGTWVMGPSSVYVVNPVSTLTIQSTSSPSSVQLLQGSAVIGSVAVLQGTDPWKVNVPTPSYIAYQLAGSVMAISGSFSAGNTSVTVVGGGVVYQEKDSAGNASVLGIPFLFKSNNTTSVLSTVSTANPLPVSVGGAFTATDSSSPNGFQFGSGGTLGAPTIIPYVFNGTNYDRLRGNSSVGAFVHIGAGSVITVSQGSIAVAIVSGSIAATFTPPANQSVSGTVQAELLSTNASIITVGGSSGNSSVQILVGSAVIGSVAVLQATDPWKVNVPTPSYISYQLAGSILAVSGSFSGGNSSVQVVGIMPPQSVSGVGLFNVNHTGNGSVIVVGSVTTLQGTNPWVISNPSVTAFQGGTWAVSVVGGPLQINSILGTYQERAAAGIASAIGIPFLFKASDTTSVLSTVSPANPLPASVSGTVLVTNPNASVMLSASTNHSVIAVLSQSSVAVLQGTNPWVVNSTGSVLAIGPFDLSPSIVGTYSEDAAHTTADKGVFVLGVRNDAMSSITSAERDYTPLAMDAAGRTVIKPFAGEQACIISYFGSVVSGSVTLIQASVIGSRSYITDFWIANTGSVAQLVTFQGGDTSIVGFTIAPAGGGSNSQGIAIPLRTTLSQDLAFKTTGTSSVVYMTVKGYQAP